MSKEKTIICALLASLAVPVLVIFRKNDGAAGDSLLLYCAAGMRKPVAELAAAYESEHGVRVKLQFAGSGTLLGAITASGRGDLYLAADAGYVDTAREKGLAGQSVALSRITAGLLAAGGNPTGVKSLNDLLRLDELRIVLGNPEMASIGKHTREVLEEAGVWQAVEAKVHAMKPTVNELANDVKIGAADVAIVWDAVAAQYPELDFIPVPEFSGREKTVTVCVLKSSENPERALHFAKYLAAGEATFRRRGFEGMEASAE